MSSRISRSKAHSQQQSRTSSTKSGPSKGKNEEKAVKKLNVCPICERGFEKLSGLRQHWSKCHPVDDINSIILNRTQLSPQQPAPLPTCGLSTNISPAGVEWNKLQIIKDDIRASTGKSYYLFDIIENNADGDCLFSAVLEFLKRYEDSFPNVPFNSQALRSMAVNHIVESSTDDSQSNFERFRIHLIDNLKRQIPSFSSTDTQVETLERDYVTYMSSTHNYGTSVELCAMSELFQFGFYVLRKNDNCNYTCYDYGSIHNAIHQPTPIIYLLFSGDVNGGHFNLLLPKAVPPDTLIPLGAFKLVEDCTSSRTTSIAPISFSGFVPTPLHETTHTSYLPTTDSSFEDFVVLLARCRSNIRVLKRVPRGARILAANRLSQLIEECLANPELPAKWKNLLTFTYTSLRVPDKVNNVSLSTMVKRNISKAELIFTKRTKKNRPISLSKRVESKVADGDIKGAVRILSSTDTLAPQNVSTFDQLRAKHPPSTREMSFPDPPDKDIEPLVVSEIDVFYTTKSFPNGSGSGIDGLLPQHLKDLTLPSTGEAGLRLLRATTDLTNYMLSGKVQSEFIKIMYGASLCALDKKGGGVRPIAVGNTFRRITSKLASASVRLERASKFAPRQVGFGVKGGCEAAAHATRTFIKKNTHRKVVIVKIDLRNAFNEVDRDIFLNEMRVNCPSIFPYLWQCYSSPTLLFYGDFILLSQNGAQQGDPCGPLLFSSAIQFVIDALVSEFVIFYLDDGTIAGEYESVLRDFETVKEECAKIGLHINTTKCELFFCSEVDQDTVDKFNQLSPGICVVNEFTLLGTSITDNSFNRIFREKLNELKTLFERLLELENHHIAFYILKNCFAIPKLVFLLRTTPMWRNMNIVDEIDEHIKSTLETLTNSHLDSNTWTLASLPVNAGGIGVRKVRDTALPAFLSSVNAVTSMVSTMLNLPTLNILEIADYEDSLNAWNRSFPGPMQPLSPAIQKQWDSIVIKKLLSGFQPVSSEETARFLAVQRPESGAWLHALPSKSIGTLLDNNAFRIIMGLRLGIDICAPHSCICGSQVDKKGYHGLSCKKSAGRYARHAELNTIISRALSSAGIPSKLEPTGLVREDGKRVDGMTLIPWSKGCSLIWDATCTDTVAPSNIRFSTREAGRAADDKAQRKVKKYEALINQNYYFVPFAVETMGPWSQEAIVFFNLLSKMITLNTFEPRSSSFLKQRLSMAIQRGNAAAVMGTFRGGDKMDEFFYLL